MLEILDAPPVSTEPRVTYWAGDPAIDAEKSPLDHWAATGEADALVIREGMTPTPIRWRPLDEVDENLLPPIGTSGEVNLRLLMAARIGLVEIGDIRIGRGTKGDVPVVLMSEAKRLIAGLPKAKLPFWRALNAWWRAERGKDWVSKEVGDEETNLLYWLGAIILSHSFPGRRHDP